MAQQAVEGSRDARRGASDDAPTFPVPGIARAIVKLVRLVPAIVTLAFAGWAVAAALTGEGAIAAAAALMSMLALSVAARSAMSGDRL
jgi:hypothetical protein